MSRRNPLNNTNLPRSAFALFTQGVRAPADELFGSGGHHGTVNRTFFLASSPIVCGRLDILGATAFVLDEAGLLRLADDLERALPLP